MRSGAARIAAALFSVTFLSFPVNALAADTYVDDDIGNNLNSCTVPASPCLSIVTAIAKAGSGDTVRVDGGTYMENVGLNLGKSLVEENFNEGDGDSQAVVDGGATVAINVASGNSAGTIRGLTVRSDSSAISLDGPATVTGNLFDDTVGGVGVNLLIGSNAASVTNNTITDTAGDTDNRIGVQSLAAGSPTIAGNSIQNLSIGIHIANGAPTVSGNTITGTRQGGSAGNAVRVVSDATPTIVANDIRDPEPGDNTFGIDVFEATMTPDDTGATLRRNEIYDHTTSFRTTDTTGAVTLHGDVLEGGDFGLAAVDSAPDNANIGDASATNATIFDHGTAEVLPNGGHVTLDSTIVGASGIFPANGGTCAITFSRGPSTGSGCDNFQTTAAPQFVNPAANNYHLQAGSPMIDAGNPANPGFVQDLDGRPRAVDGNCDGTARRDIGADERATSCPGPPPPAADTDPPETEITKAPKRKTRKRKAKFKFAADEAGSSFECKLDKRDFAPCASPLRKKVRRKRHTFEVVATDDAGNADPTPATHAWKVKKRRRR
jgi:parallel beta-helix repeat protein